MMRVMLPVKSWFSKLVTLYEEHDGRRNVRIPADFQATISGPFGSYYVTGVDANRNGAGIQSPVELPMDTLVFLKISTLGLMGFAHVRHCSPRENGFLLGLEFREALSRDRDDAGDWSVQRLRRDQLVVWDEADA
jgi:hypothetical protein